MHAVLSFSYVLLFQLDIASWKTPRVLDDISLEVARCTHLLQAKVTSMPSSAYKTRMDKRSPQLGQNALNITIITLYNALSFVLYFSDFDIVEIICWLNFVEWLNGFVDCREQQSRDLDDYNVMTFVAFCLYSPLWLAGPTMTFNAFASHIRDRQMFVHASNAAWNLKDWSAVKLINLKLHLTFAWQQHLRDVWHFAYLYFNFLKVSWCSTSSKLLSEIYNLPESSLQTPSPVLIFHVLPTLGSGIYNNNISTVWSSIYNIYTWFGEIGQASGSCDWLAIGCICCATSFLPWTFGVDVAWQSGLSTVSNSPHAVPTV